MKILIQAVVLAIATTVVASAAMANPITPTPTLKQVATAVAQPHIDSKKQALTAKEMKAKKAADEKVAKAKAKADQEAARAKTKNDKALKVASEKQAKLAKEKAQADQKVQFAKDVKKTFTGH